MPHIRETVQLNRLAANIVQALRQRRPSELSGKDFVDLFLQFRGIHTGLLSVSGIIPRDPQFVNLKFREAWDK